MIKEARSQHPDVRKVGNAVFIRARLKRGRSLSKDAMEKIFARQLAFSAIVTLGNLISLYPDFLVPENGHKNKI